MPKNVAVGTLFDMVCTLRHFLVCQACGYATMQLAHVIVFSYDYINADTYSTFSKRKFL